MIKKEDTVSLRDNAKIAMTNAFNEAAEHFQKKQKVKITKSWFKRIFGSSTYGPHQNQRELDRRLRNYPSGDLALYRR
jgi:hypothetical protein